MYEKFGYKKILAVSDRLYLNNEYYIKKLILSSYVFHPILRKLIRYDVNIASLYKEGEVYETGEYDIVNEEQIDSYPTSEYKIEDLGDGEFGVSQIAKRSLVNTLDIDECEFEICKNNVFINKILKEDLSNEVNQYNFVYQEGQESYAFVEAFYKNEKLPTFYSILAFLNSKDFLKNSVNKLNLEFFKSDCKSDFFDYGYDKEYIDLRDDLILLINKYLTEKILLKDLLISVSNKIDSLDGEEYYPILMYLKEVIESFKKYLIDNTIILFCEHCGDIMQYGLNKKYCSLNVDGQDCKTRAKNQRQYQRRKVKSDV